MYTTTLAPSLPPLSNSSVGEGEFTPEEKHKQTVFAVSVAMCFLMVLILSIGHAAFSHIMEQKKMRQTEAKKLSTGAMSCEIWFHISLFYFLAFQEIWFQVLLFYFPYFPGNLVPRITVDEINEMKDGLNVNLEDSEIEYNMGGDSYSDVGIDTPMLMVDDSSLHDNHLHDNHLQENDYPSNLSSHSSHSNKLYMDTSLPRRKVSTVGNIPHMSHIREEFGT